jgi:hypothetical protein
MRTLAVIGAFSVAGLMAASSAFAWTQETPAKQDGGNGAAANAVDLSDNDAFQAMQDKVNGKTQSMSGFQISAGTGYGVGHMGPGAVGLSPLNGAGGSNYGAGLTGANPYGAPSLGGSSAFSYNPNPGFRGLNN